jgi:hypothetical protein
MMTELDAMMGSELATMVFLCGSVAMLIASMLAVTWLCHPRGPAPVLRTRTAP